MTEDFELRLHIVLPTGAKFEKPRFSLLNDAYLMARDSPRYAITPQELAGSASLLGWLAAIAAQPSRERLAVFEPAG